MGSPRQTRSQLLDEKFDAYVEETLEDWQAPGAIISVVKDGEHTLTRGYGTRRCGEDLLPDENTLFHIASHSKPIAAASVALLVDEGKVDWDDPLRQFIPEFQFSDSYTTEKTTVRDVLTHRAGLRFSVGSTEEPDYCFSDLLEDLRTSEPVAGLRERHSYTNAGYAILGEVVARVSGISWEDFVMHRIFEPLGMTSSYTSTGRLSRDLGDPNEIENIFLPAHRNGDVVASGDWPTGSNSVFAPAGGVVTTADDLTKWLIMQLQDGLHKGERLISTEAVREMHTSQVIVVPLLHGSRELDWAELHNPLGHFTTYGLGWFCYDYLDRKVDEHTGLGVNRSSIAVIPEENLGVVVCTNACFSTPDVWRDMRMTGALKMKVIDYFIDAPETDWSSAFLEIHRKYLDE